MADEPAGVGVDAYAAIGTLADPLRRRLYGLQVYKGKSPHSVGYNTHHHHSNRHNRKHSATTQTRPDTSPFPTNTPTQIHPNFKMRFSAASQLMRSRFRVIKEAIQEGKGA